MAAPFIEAQSFALLKVNTTNFSSTASVTLTSFTSDEMSDGNVEIAVSSNDYPAAFLFADDGSVTQMTPQASDYGSIQFIPSNATF